MVWESLIFNGTWLFLFAADSAIEDGVSMRIHITTNVQPSYDDYITWTWWPRYWTNMPSLGTIAYFWCLAPLLSGITTQKCFKHWGQKGINRIFILVWVYKNLLFCSFRDLNWILRDDNKGFVVKIYMVFNPQSMIRRLRDNFQLPGQTCDWPTIDKTWSKMFLM